MEKEKQPIALLFEDVAIYSPEDIGNLIDNLTEEQAKYMLIKSVQSKLEHFQPKQSNQNNFQNLFLQAPHDKLVVLFSDYS